MKIGTRVAVVDDEIKGVVQSLSGSNAIILTDDGFLISYDQSELIEETELLKKITFTRSDISDIKISEKPKSKNKIIRSKSRKDRQPPMEVDLHIEKLTNGYKRMSNYEILNLQVDTAQRQINFAKSKKIQRLVLIHGVGEGVLRTELEFLLNKQEGIKFYDADYQKYGNGALEVYFLQNPSLPQ